MIWTPVPLEGGDGKRRRPRLWELPPHAGAQAGGDNAGSGVPGCTVLEVLQSWLASGKTVWVIGDVGRWVQLVACHQLASAVWGMVRSAQG